MNVTSIPAYLTLSPGLVVSPVVVTMSGGRSATRVDLTVEQGATYEKAFTALSDNGEPLDFTECSLRMKVRKKHSDPDSVLSLSIDQGGISAGEGGRITLRISASETAAVPSGRYVYDLMIDRPSDRERLLEGSVFVAPEVTR